MPRNRPNTSPSATIYAAINSEVTSYRQRWQATIIGEPWLQPGLGISQPCPPCLKKDAACKTKGRCHCPGCSCHTRGAPPQRLRAAGSLEPSVAIQGMYASGQYRLRKRPVKQACITSPATSLTLGHIHVLRGPSEGSPSQPLPLPIYV